MSIIGSANFFVGRSSRSQYKIERSLRFNSADSAALTKVGLFGGTEPTTITFSCWVKRCALGVQQFLIFSRIAGDTNQGLWFSASDQLAISGRLGVTNTDATYYADGIYRDTSAWYHIVYNATINGTYTLWVNGQQRLTAPCGATISPIRSAGGNAIGRYGDAASGYASYYLAEVHFIDGQALTPSSFGEISPVTGVWRPKKYTGTYGTNGFWLSFKNNSNVSSLGQDQAYVDGLKAENNFWTTNNFSVTAGAGNDSLIDTPTPYADGGNGRGNYATGNPLSNIPADNVLSDGNLSMMLDNTRSMAATHAMVAGGKYYWEFEITNFGGNFYIGMSRADNLRWNSRNEDFSNSTYGGYSWLTAGGSDPYTYFNGTSKLYGARTSANNTVYGVAYDGVAGTLTYYVNGASQGEAWNSIDTSVGWVPALRGVAGGSLIRGTVNFGQRAFAYTPPSGFLALNTQNLPEPSIKKPSSYFDTKLYNGNNGTLTVSGLGFSPDLVWIKNREVTGAGNVIQDVVRGATAYLVSNSTSAENTNTSNNWFRAFTSDGFTVAVTTSGGTATSEWNNNGSGYVAWCWDESATPGFDIVTFTSDGVTAGGTFAHTLGVAPKMIIYKGRNTTENWYVYHADVGPNSALFLNLTNAAAATGVFNNTAPTSSVIQLRQLSWGAGNLVAYCFSEVAGFSKFGSYTGNGSTDGPFVWCGFRPAFIMIKRTDTAASWVLIDNRRGGFNVNNDDLYANVSDAEFDSNRLDILSNGFKDRSTFGSSNASAGTYIFAAFAESPFKYSLAR